MLITIERNKKAEVTVKDMPSSAPDYSSLAALLAERIVPERRRCLMLREMIKNEGVDSARLIQVIEIKARRGTGITGDPCREVIEFWAVDGRKIGEIDPLIEKRTAEMLKSDFKEETAFKITFYYKG